MSCKICHHSFGSQAGVVPHVECFSCSEQFCLRHFPEIQQSLSSSGDKSTSLSSFSTNQQSIEQHPRDDDEEAFRFAHFCPSCQTESLFHVLFLNCSTHKCARCLSFYDPALKCRTHPKEGIHELPVDVAGKLTYGVSLIDSGGQMCIANAYPFLLPGRWTCCGAICHHRYRNCPLYGDLQNPNNPLGCEAELGCIQVDHTDSLSNTASSTTFAIPSSSCSIDWGVHTEICSESWFRQHVDWNINPPHHWQISGEPVCQVVKDIQAANQWM
ncbi:hypothetical protein GEMRC1_004440 [Eukaryota sp. GEM-RC1]